MEISLTYPSGEMFYFPVNPEEITIRRDKQFETVNLLSIGEVDVPQREKVREIAFSSFFPKVHDERYCMCGAGKNGKVHPDPQAAMNRLTALMNSRDPVQLIISDTAVNALVTLSSHSSTFKGGELGDIYFDVAFRTFQEMRVRTVGNTRTNARPDHKPIPKVYTVKSGDSLWAIAKRQLGDSGKWKTIYDKNRAVIGPNPNLIKPGQKLVMP